MTISERLRTFADSYYGLWREEAQMLRDAADALQRSETELTTLRTKLEGLEREWRRSSIFETAGSEIAKRCCADDLAAVLKEGV